MSSVMFQNNSDCSCKSCSTQQKYFEISKCFEELTTEVQKAQARYNLGLSDEWNMKWGNIKGFVEEQKDLTAYLDIYIQVYKQTISETFYDLKVSLESTIQNQVNLLEQDRKQIEALIQQVVDFKKEIEDSIKSKVDRSEIPTIQNPYNQAYTNNDSPTVHSVGEALDALLYKELEITMTKTTPEIGEIGETLDVVFGWSYNKFVESQTFDSSQVSIAARSITVKGVTETTSKLLAASDGVKTKSKLITIPFKQACYYGASIITPTSEAIINTFTRDLKFDKGSTVTITANNKEYIYFVLPKSLANITFYVGGFEGGFTVIDNNFKFHRYGNVYDCILVRSDNSGLGTTTINTK